MLVIYKITNLINNKVYIGQTSNYNERVRHHKQVAFRENSKEKDKPLYKSIRKYGIENFKFEIIDRCANFDESNTKEIEYIKLYNSCLDNGFGYNLDLGGKNGNKSEATKMKISESHKGYGGGSFGKKGGDSYRARKVLCIENGKIYNSIVECAEDIYGSDCNSNRCKISSCANPKSNKFSHKGYSFRYIGNDGKIIEKESNELSRSKYNHGMRILYCNTNTEYESITLASKDIGISCNMIRDRIYGRVKCNKYKFKQID